MSTCKIKVNLELDHVNEWNKDILEEYELAGKPLFSDSDILTGVKKNKGSSTSVSTPNGTINYHTHPISAYNQGQTVWGWPSGEDIRESIKFALKGNRAHMVCSAEGLYTIQVSPCKVRKLRKLNDTLRGVLVFLIEMYFKSTHNFRCVDEINKLARKKMFIHPESYVDYANTFQLENLLPTRNVVVFEKSKSSFGTGHCGNQYSIIPNVGFPDIEGDLFMNKSIQEYLQPEDLEELYLIDQYGSELGTNESIKTLKQLHTHAKKLFSIFKSKPCNVQWNNEPNLWFHVDFFPSVGYSKQLFHDGKRYISPIKSRYIKDNSLLFIADHIKKPYIKIFSDFQTGCSINSIGKRLSGFGSFRSLFGNTIPNSSTLPLDQQKRYILYLAIIQHYIGNKQITEADLRDITRRANTLMDTHVSPSSPFHENHVRSELQYLNQLNMATYQPKRKIWVLIGI
jgi:hypothetical protein